jgi:hypothetical protein
LPNLAKMDRRHIHEKDIKMKVRVYNKPYDNANMTSLKRLYNTKQYIGGDVCRYFLLISDIQRPDSLL